MGGGSCGHSRGNPLVRAAHSRALKGVLAKQPTGASHGPSHTLAYRASCVLISLKSAPRSQARETRLLASAQSHGPEAPPPTAPRMSRASALTVPVLTGRPVWLRLLREASAGASASRLAAHQGSVRPSPDSRRQGSEHRGALSPGHKAELGCWAAPAGFTASPISGSLGARRWGALRREGRWRPEEPAACHKSPRRAL